MPDVYLIKQLLSLLHAPICLYSEKGELLQAFDDVEGQKLIEPEDFQRIKRKFTLPYIHVEENGVAFCVMRLEGERKLIGLGKLRIYNFAGEEAYQYPYCGKDEFGAIICILWKMISGNELGVQTLWAENVDIGMSLKEQVVKEIFEIQEEGRRHRPYAQEIRERDSIRRGDVAALQQSLDEGSDAGMGMLASDMVRRYKNAAICVITLASRSAIEGGLTPEWAFSMSDTFIHNIEENLTEPVKIEKAAREAEFEFAKAVCHLQNKKYNNPLIDQVRDYVFCHIHEQILVRDIAEFVGMTPNYLSEQFSQSMGVTLKQYIINEKIINSEQLLKYTDYSLQEISSFCAFSSQSRFSEYFQRKNGVTPAKYRKRYQNEEK